MRELWGRNPHPTNNAFQSNFYVTGRIWDKRIQKSSEKPLKSFQTFLVEASRNILGHNYFFKSSVGIH